MGKVVKLEKGARKGRARSQSRTALVLGGGGFTGGVYEIGALRALDPLTVSGTVDGFDGYVGTRVGSCVAAMMANGTRREEMMRFLDHQGPSEFPNFAL